MFRLLTAVVLSMFALCLPVSATQFYSVGDHILFCDDGCGHMTRDEFAAIDMTELVGTDWPPAERFTAADVLRDATGDSPARIRALVAEMQLLGYLPRPKPARD